MVVVMETLLRFGLYAESAQIVEVRMRSIVRRLERPSRSYGYVEGRVMSV